MKLNEFCARHKIKKHVEVGLLAHLRADRDRDFTETELERAFAEFMGRPLVGYKRGDARPDPVRKGQASSPPPPPEIPASPDDQKEERKKGGK